MMNTMLHRVCRAMVRPGSTAAFRRVAPPLRMGGLCLVVALSVLLLAPGQSQTTSPTQERAAAAAAAVLLFACPGDCDTDLEVKVNELVVGVNIALGSDELESCPAMDTGQSGTVDVNELVQAVGASLTGCAGAAARFLQGEGYSAAETAAVLEDFGYDCMDCGIALKDEFDADAWDVAEDLKAGGYNCNEIGHVVETLFPGVDVGQVLIDAGCDTQVVDPDTAGYDQLGAGYDVFTAYADAEFVKNRILDLAALNNDAKLLQFPVDKFSVSQFQGTTISSYVESLSMSVGLSGSYSFFSGSINTTMSQMSSVTTEWSFATVQIKHRVHGLSVVRMQPVDLRDYLLDDFADDVNSTLDPFVLFELYGTHVIGKLVVGGRLDYHLSALIRDQQQKRNIGVYAEAKFDSGFASLELNTSFDHSAYRSQYVSNEDFTLSSVGGQGQASKVWTDGDYTQWVDTVWQNPVFCDFGADPWLIPIWDLADGGCAEGSRCWEIHEAYKVYAEGKTINIPGSGRDVVVDLAVTLTIPSTETGFEPLRDYTGSSSGGYVNKGVSSNRTPTRQHDGIMEATKLWLSYKAVSEDQATEAPINGIHMFTGSEIEREMSYGPHGLLKMRVASEDVSADFSYDTCQNADWWHTTPCPTSWCAYDCDNVKCTTTNLNRREPHYTRVTDLTPEVPLQSVVLGNSKAVDKSQAFSTRKQGIWWGPQDINRDGSVDDADAQLVLDRVVWVRDLGGVLLNLNAGAENYYVYDYECPWGCCWVKTSITSAPAQYLGYVPYVE